MCLFIYLTQGVLSPKRTVMSRKRLIMSGVNGNMFRKILSKVEDMSSDKKPAFRKSISERMASPLKENSLERVPGHDMLSFE